jgi:hypothetical protein
MPPYAPLGFQTPIPPANPSTPVPPPVSLPPGANPPSMSAIPPPMDQNRVIEQIKAMLDSPDPQTRVMGQALVDRFARTPFGAFMNRLTQSKFGTPQGTQGYSDQFITKDTPQSPAGLVGNRFTPEEMAYGEKLGREIPGLSGNIHGLEMAGTALNHALAMAPFAGVLRKAMSRGGPPGPLSPAPDLPTTPPGAEPEPGWIQRRASELPPPPEPLEPTSPDMPPLEGGFPKVIEDMRAQGRPAPSPKEMKPGGIEDIYNRALDKDLPAGGAPLTKSELRKLKYTPAQLRKILGLPD